MPPQRRVLLPAAAASLAYGAALLYRIRSVPDGLVIDQAEEALRGLILLAERRLEVLTLVVGNSAETAWLYVLGASAAAFGPTSFALAFPSALATAATVFLVTLLVLDLAPETPWGIPFLLAAGSPWLLHYGRSGLRAVTAALFAALVGVLLARLARDPSRTGVAAGVGAAAALSVYGYTAARLIPVAAAVAIATGWAAAGEARRAWARAAAAAGGAGLAVSLPNVAFLAAHPREFLLRGAYAAVGDAAGQGANLVATLLLPLHYPDRYRFAFGGAHAIDGVSASLTGSGLDPLPLAAGLLAVAGLVLALPRRHDPAVAYLLALHALAVLALGPFGPSLTRLLLLAPVFAVWAALAASRLAGSRRVPGANLAVLAGLAILAALSWRTYFVRLSDPARQARNEVADAPTAMGERARALSQGGAGRVVVIVGERPNVARYFAWGTDAAVLDFWARPFDAREVAALLPARRLLVERTPLYDPFAPPGFVETPSPDPRWRELAATPKTGP